LVGMAGRNRFPRMTQFELGDSKAQATCKQNNLEFNTYLEMAY
jgi:hypothetical protein